MVADMVADIVADIVGDIVVYMVADIEVDMVADMELDNFFRPEAYRLACASSKLYEFIIIL